MRVKSLLNEYINFCLYLKITYLYICLIWFKHTLPTITQIWSLHDSEAYSIVLLEVYVIHWLLKCDVNIDNTYAHLLYII